MNTKASRVSMLLGAFLGGLALFFGAIVLLTGVSPTPSAGSAAIGGPFHLVDQNGKPFSDQDMKGKPYLVFFGYTHCPDICPTTLFEISQLFRQLGPDGKGLGALFITVDPARDTPKVMGEYVKAFDPRIIGLTGSPDAVAKAAQAFRVYFAKVPDKDAPDGYLMDHSSVIYVMRPGDGRFVATFTNETSADQMAERLRKFIANS
jgi:protein SCO1